MWQICARYFLKHLNGGLSDLDYFDCEHTYVIYVHSSNVVILETAAGCLHKGRWREILMPEIEIERERQLARTERQRGRSDVQRGRGVTRLSR